MELYLEHHGIQGQKWGVRRYQNPDGTWTAAGKNRYGSSGEVGLNSKGKLVYSNGKKISNKTRKLVENNILNDKTQEEKRTAINSEYNSAKAQLKSAKRDYKRAKRIHGANSSRFLNDGGVINAVVTHDSRIMKKAAKMTYKEAKANYKETQKKVDRYIADYMNMNLSEFMKDKK